MARLIVNPDSADAWEIELRPGPNSLGRSGENDFQIEHSSVSSSHCQIEVSGNNAMLKDLGSTNGTFVEGQLVEEARLRPGQIFCLGDVRFRFEVTSRSVPPAALPIPLPQGRHSGRLRPGSRAKRNPPFAVHVCGAFLYPVAKDGALLLVTGTIFLSIIDALKYFARFAAVKGMGLGSLISFAFLLLLTAFGIGYLASYLRRVVMATAMAEKAAPDWPDLSDFTSDIVSPFFQLLATMLACLAPAILVGMFFRGPEKSAQMMVWISCGLGATYFPMAFLAVAMFDSVAALNPLLVVPSIAKVPVSYLLAVALFFAVLTAKWSGDYFLAKAIPIPVVPSVISTLIGLYLMIVEARVLGLLYLVNKDRLGWFGRR